MRRLLCLICAAFALTPAGSVSALSAYSTHPYLDEVASVIAGRSVTIRCFTSKESEQDAAIAVWGAAAYVPWAVNSGGVTIHRPANFAIFSAPLCDVLMEMRQGREWRESWWYPWAVMVLVHESGHMRGASWPLWDSESEVNCWALRRAAPVAQTWFGLPDERVPAFKHKIWTLFNLQPKSYRKSGCDLSA